MVWLIRNVSFGLEKTVGGKYGRWKNAISDLFFQLRLELLFMNILRACVGWRRFDFIIPDWQPWPWKTVWGKYGQSKEPASDIYLFIYLFMFRITIEWTYVMPVLVGEKYSQLRKGFTAWPFKVTPANSILSLSIRQIRWVWEGTFVASWK